jgi:transcriptional regulator with XRE-family HTH domain
MYPNLKIQIFKSGIRQNHLAKQLGIGDAVLSKIIHGYRTPSEPERKLLATFLGVDEKWLFEEYEAAPAPRFPSVVTDRKAAEHESE